MIDTDLRTMRRIGNDHHPHIVHFYGALIDSHDAQLLICMEPMETSLERFYPILHSHFQFSSTQIDLFLRRLAKHVRSLSLSLCGESITCDRLCDFDVDRLGS